MGARLTRFQDYFAQAGPLTVAGHIGGGLSSSFRMVVNDLRPVGPDQVVLISQAGELVLHEEEIYRVGRADADRGLSLLMDGGIELRFSPLAQTASHPVL